MREPINKETYHGRFNYDSYMRVFTEADANAHLHWIENNIPVPHNLKRFYEELKHRLPGLMVRIDRRSSQYNGLGYNVFADIGLAFTEAPEMPVGQIGLEMDGDRNLVFYVRSDRIQNEKFSANSEGYHFKKSKNYTAAVKTARQYIKPVSINEMYTGALHAFDKAVSHIRQPAQAKMYTALTIPTNDLLEELKYMMQMGYQPKTQSFTRTLEIFNNELDEIEELQTYKPEAALVWLKPDRLEYKIYNEAGDHIALTQQDVPQWIADKLPVLQIAEAGSPIKDVGVKINPTTFWVFK